MFIDDQGGKTRHKIRYLILLFIVLCLNISCHGPEDSARKRVEADIRSKLQFGASFDEVKTYLDNSKIEYEWREKDSWRERNNAFYGIIRDVKKGLVSESIQVIIYMDNQKKLKSIAVKSIYTGP